MAISAQKRLKSVVLSAFGGSPAPNKEGGWSTTVCGDLCIKFATFSAVWIPQVSSSFVKMARNGAIWRLRGSEQERLSGRCTLKLGCERMIVRDVEELGGGHHSTRKDFLTPRLARSLRSLARRGVGRGGETSWRRWRERSVHGASGASAGENLGDYAGLGVGRVHRSRWGDVW